MLFQTSIRKTNSNRFRKELYETYAEKMKQFIFRYVASLEIAEDLMHDVFIKVFELPPESTKVNNWESYIFRVAKNHTLDYLKRNSLNIKYLETIKSEFREEDTSLSENMQEKEYFEFLRRRLNELPERSRIIFSLCREEKKTYNEVAEKLAISKNTVKHHMVLTMNKLRQEIKDQFQISPLTSPSQNE